MSPVWKVTAFFAQSAAVGLAIAFLVVLFRPDLVGSGQIAPSRGTTSYADAVAVSAPAVATIYKRTLGPSSTRGVAVRGALGSGVVIDRQGYVVTNYHVIQDADEIRVQLADGRVATPTLVGTDPETELALLRIDLPNLPTISLGRSDGLKVGDVVLAIGNSLGLSQSVTMGIVSATGVAASRLRMLSRLASKSAPGRSILFTKQTRGTWYRVACRHTVSLCASTPLTPSNTTTAPSSTRRERFTSIVKSMCPGVSMMLSLTLSASLSAASVGTQKAVVAAAVMVMPRSRSCSIQSMTVSPSWTSPILWLKPV